MQRSTIFATLVAVLAVNSVSSGAEPPRVFQWSADDLFAARASLAAGEPTLRPALEKLHGEAERALKVTRTSVMDISANVRMPHCENFTHVF